MTYTEFLDSLHLSMAQVERDWGIPRRTQEDWKAGKRTPPPYIIKMLTALYSNGGSL